MKSASWLIGAFLIYAGVNCAFSSSGSVILTVALLVAGLSIVPPVTARLRSRIGQLRPPWAPPMLAVSLVIAGVVPHIAMLELKGALASPPKRASAPPSTAPTDVDPGMVEANKLIDDWSKKDEAARYADRIAPDFLPNLASLDSSQPTSITEVWRRIVDLEYFATKVMEGEKLKLNKEQAAMHAKLRTALSAKQAIMYPRFREAYREGLKAGLWEHDIDVSGQGRAIQLVGSTYAARSNIKAAEEGMSADLQRLRFTSVTFRWIPDGEGARYRYAVPADSEVVP